MFTFTNKSLFHLNHINEQLCDWFQCSMTHPPYCQSLQWIIKTQKVPMNATWLLSTNVLHVHVIEAINCVEFVINKVRMIVEIFVGYFLVMVESTHIAYTQTTKPFIHHLSRECIVPKGSTTGAVRNQRTRNTNEDLKCLENGTTIQCVYTRYYVPWNNSFLFWILILHIHRYVHLYCVHSAFAVRESSSRHKDFNWYHYNFKKHINKIECSKNRCNPVEHIYKAFTE